MGSFGLVCRANASFAHGFKHIVTHAGHAIHEFGNARDVPEEFDGIFISKKTLSGSLQEAPDGVPIAVVKSGEYRRVWPAVNHDDCTCVIGWGSGVPDSVIESAVTILLGADGHLRATFISQDGTKEHRTPYGDVAMHCRAKMTWTTNDEMPDWVSARDELVIADEAGQVIAAHPISQVTREPKTAIAHNGPRTNTKGISLDVDDYCN